MHVSHNLGRYFHVKRVLSSVDSKNSRGYQLAPVLEARTDESKLGLCYYNVCVQMQTLT